MEKMTKDGWDGSEEEKSIQWTFAGALFYSIIVITTIGKPMFKARRRDHDIKHEISNEQRQKREKIFIGMLATNLHISYRFNLN